MYFYFLHGVYSWTMDICFLLFLYLHLLLIMYMCSLFLYFSSDPAAQPSPSRCTQFHLITETPECTDAIYCLTKKNKPSNDSFQETCYKCHPGWRWRKICIQSGAACCLLVNEHVEHCSPWPWSPCFLKMKVFYNTITDESSYRGMISIVVWWDR